MKLDDGFTLERRAMINTCHLVATGAATADTRLTGCSPPASNDVGTFDFSTFAESGTVNFTLQLFEGLGEATKLGEGSTSVPISSGNAVMGDLTVMYTGPATP
ncbi:MAG TPA: hypothetical protein VMU50_07350 [Polyangia bacterium]|nr:hypothetical protein [Polyangia bacterium]